MTETDLEISPADASLRPFDAIWDIRLAPHEPAFPSAAQLTYREAISPSESLTRGDSVLIVCDIGVRSKKAAQALREQGFRNVVSLTGGADALLRYRATIGDTPLTSDDALRYDRQIRLSRFGLEGQKRLRDATVVVVGAGGLGCPALSYLATAGVGHIEIVDHDAVELTNLQRQPLYRTEDVGRPKVDAAAERLAHLNPTIDIVTDSRTVTSKNAGEVVARATVVIDATDNFDARYALNEATVQGDIPLIYGSVYGFEGQFAVFDAASGPCYRCVFPASPAGDAVLDCATVGVLGAVTGVVGALQASAALQIAGGVDHDLLGALTMFDGRTGRFDRMSTGKVPGCMTCGSN